MRTPLRVLMIEDDENDVILLKRYLQRSGFDVTAVCVETCEAMKQALCDAQWDIVISDFRLPNFNGSEALKQLKESELDIPFIIVSGAIGEEAAVEAMRIGAHDYVMKDNLTRLGPVIERELREVTVRNERRLTEKALSESENRYRTLIEHIPAITYIAKLDNLRTPYFFNQHVNKLLGFAPEEFLRQPDFWQQQIHPDDRIRVNNAIALCIGSHKPLNVEYRMLTRNKEALWFLDEATIVCDLDGIPTMLQGVMMNITDNKESQEALRNQFIFAQEIMESVTQLAERCQMNFFGIDKPNEEVEK
jgi:PAS domain S-box-containing protein